MELGSTNGDVTLSDVGVFCWAEAKRKSGSLLEGAKLTKQQANSDTNWQAVSKEKNGSR